MDIHDDLAARARALSKNKRIEIIKNISEVELHHYLKDLFSAIQPDYLVEVTHGQRERGKDLVLVNDAGFTKDVIGIVVKKGDIRAKTSGEVDDVIKDVKETLNHKAGKSFEEIMSQINQAKLHDAELKKCFDRLPVTKVLVVIAGDISNNVRERIEKELSHIDKPYDLNWLVDNFTEYYPQVFFERGALNFILEKIQELETKFSIQSGGETLNLSEYFTEPLLSPVDLFSDREEGLTNSVTRVLERRKIHFSSLKTEIALAEKLLMFGDQGTGKSGSITKYVVDELKRCAESISEQNLLVNNLRIPILVHAKEVLEAKTSDDLVASFIGSKYSIDDFGVTLLAVDGLDEVAVEQRKEVLDKSEEFAGNLNSALVITSRKVDLVEDARNGYKEYELLPFEYSQAINFLNKILANNQNALESLSKGLLRLDLHFPLIPLSLKMLIRLAEEYKEVPASITELYERYFDLALGREDIDKGISVIFDYLIKKRLLAKLAYEEFFQKNRLSISKQDYDKYLDSYFSRYLADRSDDQIYSLEEEIRRSGILQFGYEVSFKHRTYLEYFVAQHLVEYRDEVPNINDLLAESHMNLDWDDVTFFFVGTQRRISKLLLEKIREYSDDDLLKTSIAKVRVGKLLQAGWHSETNIKIDGIQLSITNLPTLRDSFIKMLEDSGHGKIPRIFGDYILSTVCDSSLNSSVLQKELRQCFDLYSRELSIDNLFACIFLTKILSRFSSKDETIEMSSKCLEMIDHIKKDELISITAEEEMRVLIALGQSNIDSKELEKTIKNKLKRLMRNAPDIAQGLLPYKKNTRKDHPAVKKKS